MTTKEVHKNEKDSSSYIPVPGQNEVSQNVTLGQMANCMEDVTSCQFKLIFQS